METVDLAQNKKSVTSYLLDGLTEGIKQNFLGPDIDMGFFILSLQVYFIKLNSFAMRIQENLRIEKYSETDIAYTGSQNIIFPVFN